MAKICSAFLSRKVINDENCGIDAECEKIKRGGYEQEPDNIWNGDFLYG